MRTVGSYKKRLISVKTILKGLLLFVIISILASISVSATSLNNTAFAGFIAPVNNSILTGTVTFNFTLNSSSSRTNAINISVVNYTMVSVYDGATVIILCSNVTGAAAINVTACTNNTASFQDGLYNITIHIANQTSALTGAPNSTTFTLVNVSFENYGPRVIISSPGNSSGGPGGVNDTILTNANFLNREFEINFSLRDNVAAQNRSFFCELHAIKNRGSATAIGGDSALDSFILNKTVTFFNGTNFTFKVPTRNVLLNGSDSSYQVKCRNSEQSFLYNISFIQNLTVSDVVLPDNVTAPTFKDKNNEVKTKFEFGDTVTISDCSGTDNTDEDVQYNITIKFPGISSFTLNNVSLSLAQTTAIGIYEVNCSASDSSGNINSSMKTFEIVPKIRDTNAYAVSKAGRPVSKGIVGSGSSESIEVGAEGIGRLVAEGGSLKFTVNNEEHMVIVKEIGKDSVILTVKSTPFDLSLNKGDTKDVDVDGDGAEDVNIKFNGVFFNKADITLTLLERAPAKTTTEEKVTPPSKVSEAIKKVTEGKGGIWLVIIVVIIIVVVGYLLVRKR